MNREELIARVADELGGDERVTQRFVRFLVAEGIMDGPRGSRAKPEYGENHVVAMLRYLRLRDAGLPVAAIRAARAGAGTVLPLVVAPGVTVIVDLSAVVHPVDPRRLARDTAAAVADLVSLRFEDKE